ncbi:MFS general substrate transporter [Trametes elegans]|nr:MFS general substrate transporter [Trametes elegans]
MSTDGTSRKELSRSDSGTAVCDPEPAQDGGVDQERVLRKLDWRLLPLLCLMFILSFLDRINIGNAKVAGLVTDLHLNGLQYNICAALFFIPYCLFEIPANIAMKVMSPSRWIPLIVFCWGAVVVSMAFVKDFSGLLTARIFLGMTESGLLPGITSYLCIWYPRAQQARRIATFSAMATIAGAFGGILAYAIEKMNGLGGLAGWSWIFLLEGLFTMVVAAVAYLAMYDHPENANFLTDAERAWLLGTLRVDSTGLSRELRWTFLVQALKDPCAYLMIALFLVIYVPAYSFVLFLPTIISGLGFSAANAQLLTIPPNVVGGLSTVLMGTLSVRHRVRGPILLAGLLLALAGYIILYATTSPGAGYAGTMIAACGIFPAVAFMLGWTGGNIGGEVKRAIVLAMVIGFGNLGGIASAFIYRPQDSPRYHPGHAANIGCISAAIILCSLAMLEFSRLNRRKAEQCARDGITEDTMSEFADMGDASPLFRCAIIYVPQ